MGQDMTAHGRKSTDTRGITGATVIIPAYNEERSVAGVVGEIQRVFAQEGIELELIVVDDGSSDETAARAEEAGAKVVRHPENLGYGKAILTGAGQAAFDYLAIIDADSTYAAEELPRLVKALVDYDMAVGAREGIQHKESRTKRMARWAFTHLARYVTGADIPDVNSGMRAFRKQILADTEKIICFGFSFSTTLTLSVHSRRLFVKYINVPYEPRGEGSHVKKVRDTLRALQIILQTIVYYNPMKAVLPFCAGAGIVALLFFLAFLSDPGATLALGAATSLFFAVLLFVLGMVMDSVRMRR